jgi:hypothetical protein
MKRSRIAVIGDTALVHGELTDGGAIASELALLGHVDVGFRSVATSRRAWEHLETHFGRIGVTTWLTIRNLDTASDDVPIRADLRMGDPIDIAEVFDHDVVVLASRDVRLRRFLSDLPVHTRPDVRMLALLHFEDGVPPGERVEDLLRFDAIAGSDADVEAWGRTSDLPVDTGDAAAVIRLLHGRMHGTNLRALMSWGEYGAATLAEPLREIVTFPASHAPRTRSAAPWAAFVATLAFGMAQHQPCPEIAQHASQAFARRCREIRRSHG